MRYRPLVAVALAACTHAAAPAADVPIAFGRWQPPDGQSCYVDALQPPELPRLSALLDSAAVAAELRAFPPGDVLITLSFDSLGNTERARVIDRRMSLVHADSVRGLIASHLRAPAARESWGARLRASTGASASLALGRRDLCPPILARIDPLALGNLTLTERELELVAAPDWIIRGAGPPAPAPRSAVTKAVAGQSGRDTARVTVDSTRTAPDVSALGANVLMLRVLIDTMGTIAHAEISRAAAAGVDRVRLVAELARYRFHPALEDRVRTPAWVFLRIQ